jgi:RNA polymerase sigma factor (sigma-70 family)
MINHLTDEELISSYRKDRNMENIGVLFARYRDLILGLCIKYFKDISLSEDAVLEIFEKLIEKLKTHEVEHFRSWLYTLSRNHCLENLRSAGHKFIKENEAKNMYYEALLHPDDSMMKEDMLTKLEDCIAKLPERQKLCVQLFYLEKRSYQELADQLKMNWNKVRSYIQNGRRNLKICMEN